MCSCQVTKASEAAFYHHTIPKVFWKPNCWHPYRFSGSPRLGNAGFIAGFTLLSWWVNPPTPHRGAFSGQPPETKTLLTHSYSPAAVRQRASLHHIRGGQPRLAQFQQGANIGRATVRCVSVWRYTYLSHSTLWPVSILLTRRSTAVHHTSQTKAEEGAERRMMSGKTEQESEDGEKYGRAESKMCCQWIGMFFKACSKDHRLWLGVRVNCCFAAFRLLWFSYESKIKMLRQKSQKNQFPSLKSRKRQQEVSLFWGRTGV